jgi:subtilisin family serine protease
MTMSTLRTHAIGVVLVAAVLAVAACRAAVAQEGTNDGGGGGDGEARWRWDAYQMAAPPPEPPPPPLQTSTTPKRRPAVRTAAPRQAPRVAAQPPARASRAGSRSRTAQRPRSAAPSRAAASFVADEVLVQTEPGVSQETLDGLARRHRLALIASEDLSLIGQLHRFRITNGRSPPGVARRLDADRRVAAAQPNFLFTLQQTPRAAKPAAPQYAIEKLRLPEAHQSSKGEGVVVAVIDSGVDGAHPELAGAVAGAFDVVGGAAQPHAHGTAVAAAIAARGELTAMAPEARLLAIRAFAGGPSSPRATGTSFQILKALDWAYSRQAKIVNLSFAGPRDPLLGRALDAARDRGLVLIAAAGNAGPRSPALFPAAERSVIAVTAIDARDALYPAASRGGHIALAAPGVDVVVAAPGGGYGLTSGTSIAAAHVSGLAALLLARKPNLPPARLKALLTGTAKDLGPAGNDASFGAGLPDIRKALDQLEAAPEGAVRGEGAGSG